MSMKTFNLKCQRLQVGDICISLTERKFTPNEATNGCETKVKEPNPWPQKTNIPENIPQSMKNPNLIHSTGNVYNHTIPPSTPPNHPTLYNLPHLYNPYLNFANVMPPPSAFINTTAIPNFFLSHQLMANSGAALPTSPTALHFPYLAPFLAAPMSLEPMRTSPSDLDENSLAYAKKRRWSAPENNCDDDQNAKRFHLNEVILEHSEIR